MNEKNKLLIQVLFAMATAFLVAVLSGMTRFAVNCALGGLVIASILNFFALKRNWRSKFEGLNNRQRLTINILMFVVSAVLLYLFNR